MQSLSLHFFEYLQDSKIETATAVSGQPTNKPADEVTWEAKPHKATEPNQTHKVLNCSTLAAIRLKETSQSYSDPSQRNFKSVDF